MIQAFIRIHMTLISWTYGTQIQTDHTIDQVLWHCHYREDIFFNTDLGSQGNDYKVVNGDGSLDIWVSRIMGENIHQPTSQGRDQDLQMNLCINISFRAHNRMSSPASVPPRSFSMSSITDPIPAFNNSYPDDVLELNLLKLQFHTVFRHPANNPANLQAQLQAGPRGNINYGAYFFQLQQLSVLRTPVGGWNTRNCIYSSFLNITTGATVNNLDTLGYEWAGIYNTGIIMVLE